MYFHNVSFFIIILTLLYCTVKKAFWLTPYLVHNVTRLQFCKLFNYKCIAFCTYCSVLVTCLNTADRRLVQYTEILLYLKHWYFGSCYGKGADTVLCLLFWYVYIDNFKPNSTVLHYTNLICKFTFHSYFMFL